MANVVLNDKEGQKTTVAEPTAAEAQTDTKKDICRIVVDPDIKRQIVLDELSIESTDAGEKNEDGTAEKSIKKIAGREFPMIKINDYIVAPEQIQRMSIYLTDRIPTLSLSLKFEDSAFKSKNMPKDGDIVSVFFSPKTDTITSIRADFVITGAPVSQKAKVTANINGRLFVPGFEADAIYGYVGTSKNTFIETAKRYGLGFATDDLDDTNDKQLWICPNMPAEMFLNETISHTWKDEMSFFDWWIDQYYNLNFINVNKIILQNTKDVDVTAASSIIGGSYDTEDNYSQENTKAVPKLFTNVAEMENNAFFVTKWSVYNNSTSITFDDGVEIISREFLHNPNLGNDREQTITSLSNVPAYDPNKIDDHIILRGRAEYDPSKNPKEEQARANYNYKDIYIKKPWCGISYVMSDGDENDDNTNTWSGNINKNFTRAPYHNKINIDELDKLYIKITVSGICSQVMRGEVVPVILKKDKSQEMSQEDSKTRGKAELFYNGYYYVSDMAFYFKKGDPMAFETELTLKRREWPIPVDYIIDEEETTTEE